MRVAIVHYHLDPGGVTTVIEAASRALAAAGIRHVILTGPSPSQGGCGVSPQTVARVSRPEHLQIPHLGYLPTAEITAKDLLISMRTAATEALGGPPDLWHFHNHSLGKNILIADVVALLAEQQEPIILQIHDLAENGRPQNLPILAACRNPYPFSPRIRYAFLNTRDLDTFTTAGLPTKNASLLPNPISAGLVADKSSSTILFAPIRAIRRKNIGELILLSALAPKDAYFAISRAPKNSDALAIHDTWRKFVTKHQLPIEFDVVDRFAPTAGAKADFESWISHASHIVTTSVAEGFGLPFLESIAWRKPLLGRDLPHLTHSHGFNCGLLYQKLLIPVDWIDLTILESHLTTTLERNFRLSGRPLTSHHIAAALEALQHGDLLDFGNLTEPLQQGVIERLSEKADRSVPLVEIKGETRPLIDWLAETIAIRTPSAMPDQLAPWSLTSYQEQLGALYRNILDQPAAPLRFIRPSSILDAHLNPASFHFLLSAPEPALPKVRFRAVVFDIYGTLLIAPGGGVKPEPLTDPVLREIIRQAGYAPPTSPSTELHAAVLRHHAAAGVPYPEIDLRVLWREILSIEPDAEITPLVIELETAWHPARPMPGADKIIQRLARAGISLGLLSNAQCNTLPSLGDISDLFAPELTLLSYQQGIAKPAPELFQLMAGRLAGRGISPAETLYIGNDPLHDIVPAFAAGFKTALYTGHPDSLRPGDCRPDHTFQHWSELNELF